MHFDDNVKKLIASTDDVRHEVLFSCWIFAWAMLYYLVVVMKSQNAIMKFVYNHCNPTFALYVALFHNICCFIFLLMYHPHFKLLCFFVMVILSMKVFPLYLLSGTKINMKSNIMVSIVLFMIYFTYLHSINMSVYQVYVTDIVEIIQHESIAFFKNYKAIMDYFSGH